jgi:dephospho-CoA kinase
MIVLGLTGSIAMGKSHAARIFRAFGVPVFDADAEVHALTAPGGAAVGEVGTAFPASLDPRGGIDREALGRAVFGNVAALRTLEAILHPRVREAERAFLAQARARGRWAVVLDIPLLLETGGERRCDRVAVVTAPAFLQAQRALARPGMTANKLDSIRRKQLKDVEKRRRADYVIRSGLDRGETVRQIGAILQSLRGVQGCCWPCRWRGIGMRSG